MARSKASQAERWRVKRFDTIDSTNRWLLDEARRGEPEGLVVVADEQTAGRGRRGRSWSAPPGSSLLVSVLLRPAVHARRAHLVTMAAAVAMRAAVRDVAGVTAAVKWPNDLVVGDRKLAGVLAESELGGDGALEAVVVGVGCNVDWVDFPSDLAATATACNVEAGHPVDRAELLTSFLDHLAVHLDALDAVPSAYRDALVTIGRRVRVDLGTNVLEGVATDVDDHGRLVVRSDDGAQTVVAVGDVVHLRDA
jgi:BirA family biotin operon repressor/biotin-[acetyl-CoA-carboxylase] ligase